MKCVRGFCVAVVLAGIGCGVFGEVAGAAGVTGVPRVSIPVYEGRDAGKIADDDTVITQVIPLVYLTGESVRDTLNALVKPGTPMAAVNNALVVTETSGVVKRIVQIICLLDVERPSGNVIAVVPVYPVDAAEAARLVNAVFGAER